MPKTTTRAYQLLEQRLGQKLRPWVKARRKSGASWNDVARDLFARTEVSVTSETLRNWFKDVDAPRSHVA